MARLAFAVLLAALCAAGCKKESAATVDAGPPLVVPVVEQPPPTVRLDIPTVTIASPSAPTPSATPMSISILERATEAASEGRSSDVRRLLEAKVRAGHGSPEEVRLVRTACSSPFDKSCVEDIKSKYP